MIKYEECHNADGSWKDISSSTCAYRSLAESATTPYTPFLITGQENLKVPAWLNETKYYHNQGDSTFAGENSVYGDFFGLDDLKTEDPHVVQGMVDIFKSWIKDFNIDGFRIDTVKHVNIEFWEQWTPQILEYAAEQGNHDFFMFGEVFDARPDFLSTFTTEGKLPSVLDFGFQGITRAVLAGMGATNNMSSFFDADDYYNDVDSNASQLMNFAGNHDMGRIGYFINNNSPDDFGEQRLARSKLAHAFMFFARGIPVIYYGDEQGFTGDGGDQDARENMFPSQVDVYNDNALIGTNKTTADDNFDSDHPLYLAIKNYAEIYKAHKALWNGLHFNRYSTDSEGIYAFSRVDLTDQEEYLVAFNSAKISQSVTLQATSNSYTQVYPSTETMNATSNNVTLEVPALDFVIYKADSRLARLAEAPELEITSHLENDFISGRVEIQATVEGAAEMALPFLKVVFEVKIGNSPNYQMLAEDWSYPYRFFWKTDDIANGTSVSVRATVHNLSGDTEETITNLIVNSNTPSNLLIRYENGASRNSVYAMNHLGRMRGPFTLDGSNEFSIPFGEDDESVTLVFETYDATNDVFDFDKLLYLTRTEIFRMTTQINDELVTSFYINNNHEISTENNFVNSGTPPALTRNDSAPNPFGTTDLYLRGSLSGWGVNDKMIYKGNYTFKFTRLVEAGDVEFKFADDVWSDTANFGLPFTDLGISSGGLSGNIQFKVPKNEMYDFYYFHYPLNGETQRFYRVTPTKSSLGEHLYLRGDFSSWEQIAEANRFGHIGNDVYELIIEVTQAQTYQFKVASDDWNDGVIFGGISSGSSVMLDSELSLLKGLQSHNLSLEIETLGTYKFTFDYSDSTNPKLTVTLEKAADAPVLPFGETAMYLRGDMNQWSATQAFSYVGDNKYTIYINLETIEYEFKIADENWTLSTMFGQGTSGASVSLGTEYTLGSGDGLSFIPATSGIHEFVLDATNTTNPTLTISKPNHVAIIHYHRNDNDYEGWGLHLWNGAGGLAASESTEWETPKLFDQVDDFGRFAVIQMADTTLAFNFIIHKGDTKNYPDDQMLTPTEHGLEVWLIQDTGTIFTSKAEAEAAISP